MKLPDFKTFAPFNKLRKKMGADNLGKFDINFSWKPLSETELSQLQNTGIDVDASEIKFLHDKTIRYRDRRVLVYIRDVKNYRDKISLPKFHIALCSTLEQMRKENRFNSRYVVSTKSDGKFVVNIPKASGFDPKDISLDVCKNCLRELNFNNYINDPYRAFKAFKLTDFFARYACTPLHITPNETDRTAPINQYPPDWELLSLTYKESMNWECEICLIDLSESKLKRFLHTHHINGNTYNCRPSNLKALCVKCHANEPLHAHMKKLSSFKEFIKLSTLK